MHRAILIPKLSVVYLSLLSANNRISMIYETVYIRIQVDILISYANSHTLNIYKLNKMRNEVNDPIHTLSPKIQTENY